MIKNQRGQSTIEFIFAFAFALSIMLMIFTSAKNYATGYLVHYATFMASRVYLTTDNSLMGDPNAFQPMAGNMARETFGQYNLGVFGVDVSKFSVNQARTGMSAADALMVGTVTRFDQKIDVMGKLFGNTKVDLISESFLGKEPTRYVCALRVCKAITNQENCSPSMDITLYDDGC